MDKSQENDFILELLVRACNKGKAEISITLTVKGSLISGTLIGGEEYFKGVGEQYNQVGNEMADALSGQFLRIGEKYNDEEDDQEEDYPIGYLHLKNAKVYSGNATLPENGTFWRVRIEEVDGFTFGSFHK